jgi:hypothetical protein
VQEDDDRARGAALLAMPALERLERAQALRDTAGVQRYRALRAAHGPVAGSEEAAGTGRAAGRLGAQAEAAVVAAFEAIARRLGAVDAGAGQYRVEQGLRPLRGLPPASAQAKDEWDVALLRAHIDAGADPAGTPHELVLLAEVKASPGAAAQDLPRLLRGLQRLASASAEAGAVFATARAELRLDGASLQALAPHGHALPPQVIYACPAAADAPLPLLGAAARAMLLAEPASLAFAGRLAQGDTPHDDMLEPVWQALQSAARLRGVLHQRETARAACAALLHPDDLRSTLESMAASWSGSLPW